MRSLPIPELTAKAILDACAASVQDEALRLKIGAVCSAVEDAETTYIARGPAMTLYEIKKSETVIDLLDKAALKKLYCDTFVRSAKTRPMYDFIKSSPANAICPLCSQRTVSTLDHYLPQASHAVYTLVPANLVPACSECNKDKLDRDALTAGEQSFHPYFENCDDSSWLQASVEEGAPACISFAVRENLGWPASKAERVRTHFNILKLASLYASHAAVEITNIRLMLRNLLAAGSPKDVSAFLSEVAASSRAANPNSWRTATYDALTDSQWFCDGGFDS